MFEDLEGRLRWERTPQAISVEIPARRGTLAALFIPIVAIWLVFGWAHYSYQAGKDPSDDLQSTLQAITVGGVAVAFIFLVCWLAWTFTSQTFLTLSQDEMKIQHRVMGIDLVTRSYQTRDTHNLTFIPPTHALGQGLTDPRTSKIQFQVGNQTHTFAAGVTAAEAHALIERMLEACKIPTFLESRDAHAVR